MKNKQLTDSNIWRWIFKRNPLQSIKHLRLIPPIRINAGSTYDGGIYIKITFQKPRIKFIWLSELREEYAFNVLGWSQDDMDDWYIEQIPF